MSIFREMINRYAFAGQVEGLWLRGARRQDMVQATSAAVRLDGLVGDHGRAGKRAVTLIQAEHLWVIGAVLRREPVDPAVLRRNVVVSGLNLNALKRRQVQIGKAVIEITTLCAPCSRMEEALGPGGYSAMRGHGGWCAQVLQPGVLRIGDTVTPVEPG